MAGMFTQYKHSFNSYSDSEFDNEYIYRECHHRYIPAHECEECDAEINEAGGIDKCLNCGRYKTGNQLNADQVCKRGCVNPNEY